MAFAMAFFLTPRVWVENAGTPSSEEIPVDALEQPDSCLWCDDPGTVPGCDGRSDHERLWLNPDDPSSDVPSDECKDAKPGSEPNA